MLLEEEMRTCSRVEVMLYLSNQSSLFASPSQNPSQLKDISVRHRKVWRSEQEIRVRTADPATVEDIQQYVPSKLAATILALRGFKADARLFDHLRRPLSSLRALAQTSEFEAARRFLTQVIQKQEAVAICCDYDVDGLSGACQFERLLKAAGVKTFTFVPHRIRDGYGLKTWMIRAAYDKGCRHAIAVDLGTTDEAALSLAQELGIQALIADHHHVKKEPDSFHIFLNPHLFPAQTCDSELCGSGLSLISCLSVLALEDPLIEELLALAALGTICDLMPLQGINRIIAHHGLRSLRNKPSVGLSALLKVSALDDGRPISVYHCGFDLGPRINAAGRMADPMIAYKLLRSEDPKEANEGAGKLNNLNMQRKRLEAELCQLIDSRYSPGDFDFGAVVVIDRNVISDAKKRLGYIGVMGIVASRITETYGRPSVVLVENENGQVKGSLRTIEEISVIEILNECSATLDAFGGHSAAGGCSLQISQLASFTDLFRASCSKRLLEVAEKPFYVDAELSISDISPVQDIIGLNALGPFGAGNPSPIILLKGLQVRRAEKISDTTEHYQISFSEDLEDSELVRAIWWDAPSTELLESGHFIDVLGRINTRNTHGKEFLELDIISIRKHL